MGAGGGGGVELKKSASSCASERGFEALPTRREASVSLPVLGRSRLTDGPLGVDKLGNVEA